MANVNKGLTPPFSRLLVPVYAGNKDMELRLTEGRDGSLWLFTNGCGGVRLDLGDVDFLIDHLRDFLDHADYEQKLRETP